MGLMEKPRAMEKFRRFYKAVKDNKGCIGTSPRVVELAYSNACNFKCEHCHCSVGNPYGKNSSKLMPIERIKLLADEADALGYFEWNVYGGEPLVFKEKMEEILRAIDTSRFYVFVTSNGYLMTPEYAKQLAGLGVDRVSISIDSMVPETHDAFRGGIPGAHGRALKALEYVKDAGMDPYMNITVGHFNAFSDDVENLCRYSFEHGYKTFVNIAIPSGNWNGNLDVIVDDRDKARLIELRKKYGNILRDIWNPFDKMNEGCLGCQTMSKLYITPAGDVLPCSFLHVKLGNVYDSDLEDIVERGYRIRRFREHSDICLAGEDREFIMKYMQGEMSSMNPVPAEELFELEEY